MLLTRTNMLPMLKPYSDPHNSMPHAPEEPHSLNTNTKEDVIHFEGKSSRQATVHTSTTKDPVTGKKVKIPGKPVLTRSQIKARAREKKIKQAAFISKNPTCLKNTFVPVDKDQGAVRNSREIIKKNEKDSNGNYNIKDEYLDAYLAITGSPEGSPEPPESLPQQHPGHDSNPFTKRFMPLQKTPVGFMPFNDGIFTWRQNVNHITQQDTNGIIHHQARELSPTRRDMQPMNPFHNHNHFQP
jgi:hypothetical protein